MHSVNQKDSESNTVVNQLKEEFKKEEFIQEDKEAGLVQRLDYSSSGVIIAAKNNEIKEKLIEELKKEHFFKNYLIIVEGEFEKKQLTLSNYIGSRYRGSKKVKVYENEEKRTLPATSNFKLVKIAKYCSLLEVKVNRGRRHQIRAHSSYLKHPLLGDSMYGAEFCFESFFSYKRDFFLHCKNINFKHPCNSSKVVIEAKLSNTEAAFIRDTFGVIYEW